MKILMLLQGVPASGKSTWVKKNKLEDYTISSDEIRKQVGATYLGLNGLVLDQSCNEKVFELIHQMVEIRFRQGALTIVDATHLREKDISAYNGLCKKYGYRKYIIRFDISLEEAVSRDAKRMYPVGANVIQKCYSRYISIKNPDSWNVIPSEAPLIKWISEDLNDYDHVNVFGDIHGCVKPLEEYFNMFPFSEKEFYVFTGDFLDRGPENKRTIELLLKLSLNDNVVFCTGNHELHLIRYLNGEDVVSKEFLKTIEDIKDVDKHKLSKFARSLRQMFLFDYQGQRYFVNHGGLPCCPQDELIKIPTIQLIKGVGGYDDPIDDYYEDFYASTPGSPIQIHGHRNLDLSNGRRHSINLEGGVERGGCLKVWRDGEVICIDNPITDNDFRSSPLIKVKQLKNGVESYNFTREAFHSKSWNNLTLTARGLFMKDNQVVARGYNKFFNIEENPETSWKELIKKEGPITCYKKENGFLGLLSYYDNSLNFHSKSTNEGSFAGYFKKIFYELPINHNAVEAWLKENNYTLTFEVIDVKNDPHIVEYQNNRLVLLDAIKNNLVFERLSYSKLCELAKMFNCEVKQVEMKFNSFRNLRDMIANYDYNPKNEEGLVIELGDYMCKFKSPWYRYWKNMRTQKERLKNNLSIEINNDFIDWLKPQPELWDLPITKLRKMFYEFRS